MFYTRIPVPRFVKFSEDNLNKSTKYFPLIGWLVGSIGAFSFFIFQMFLPHSISIALSMVTTILTTGAFHEDGFADVCDGFGGGWTKEKILEIMKDSRLGTYGAIGLVAMLGLKFMALNALSPTLVPFVLIAGHSISRLSAASMIAVSSYSRMDELSKVKPIGKKLETGEYIFAILLGILPLLLFRNFWVFGFILVLFPILSYFKYYFEKWIDGYTGDCLGTIQQVSEVFFYLFALVIFHTHLS